VGQGRGFATTGRFDYRTRDLFSSKGLQQQVNQQIKQGCASGKTSNSLNLESMDAFKNIPYDLFHSPVGGQVGGYQGDWKVSDGTAQITIVNYAGAYSFFYHAVDDRKGTSGPFRTIKQTFVIKEPSPCGPK
jgi:hypothetical protein